MEKSQQFMESIFGSGPGLRITTGAASTLLPFTAIPLQSHRALHMHRWHGPLLIMALHSSCSLPRRSRVAVELPSASALSSRSCFYFHWFTCSFAAMPSVIGSESDQYHCNCLCKAARIFIGSPTLSASICWETSFQPETLSSALKLISKLIPKLISKLISKPVSNLISLS